MRYLFLITILFLGLVSSKLKAQCGASTPVLIVDLSHDPNATWISPDTLRLDTCCGAVAPDKCIQFIVTLHPDAEGIIFDIFSGAVPPGALFYQVDCGSPTQVGQALCLSGVGPHNITFCKPGNNSNEYSITSVSEPGIGPNITVNDGCNGEIYAFGYDVSTITWTSISPGAPGTYDGYLNCTAGCDSVNVNAQPGFPPYVDYQVCGLPYGGCDTLGTCDTLRVTFNSTLAANITPINPTICFGSPGTTITANGTGGTPPYNYVWNTGDTTQSLFVTTVGTYYVTLGDSSGCPPTTDTVVVTAFSASINANAGVDQTICETNVPVVLNGSVAVASGGYWTGGAGTYLPNDSTLNATYTPTAAELNNGSVDLYLTTTGNGTCPPDVDTINIVFTTFDATILLTTNDVGCAGGNDGSASVNLTGGAPPFNITWNVVPVQIGTSATGLSQGNYTFTVVDTIGCDTTMPFVINEPLPLQAFISDSINVSCQGGSDGSATAAATGGTTPYSFLWDAGAGGQTDSTADNLIAGTYNVVVTDTNGCVDSTMVTITEPNTSITLAITITDVSCNGGSDGAITVVPSGGTPPYNYLWSTSTVIQAGNSITGLDTGTYSVTVFDANNCLYQPAIIVNEPQPVILSVTPNDTICPNNFTTIGATASGGNGGYVFTWNQGLPNLANHNVNPGVETTYQVSVADGLGCTTNPDSITIYVYEFNLAGLSVSSGGDVCEGTPTSVTGNYSGGIGGFTYSWNQGLGNNLGTYTVVPTDTTDYILTVTDQCNRSIADTVTINVFPYPVVNLPPVYSSGCAPLTVTFHDSINDNNAMSYVWTFGDGNASNAASPTHVYTVDGTYNISVEVMSPEGCTTTSSNTSVVEVFPDPQALFDANPQITNLLNPNIAFDNQSVGGANYLWDFGNGDTGTTVNPNYTYSDTGTYYVNLTVTSINGCVNDYELPIIINPYYTFTVPNAFTPNPNGPNGGVYDINSLSNDVFYPFTEYVEEFQMFIFNRWGEIIFESKDINIGWDGYYRENICQQDTYVWKINITYTDGEKISKVGDVTLMR